MIRLKKLGFLLLFSTTALGFHTDTFSQQHANGSLLDLDARYGVKTNSDGNVTSWESITSRATLGFNATRFDGGMPKRIPADDALDGQPSITFARQELINSNEDIFDPLTTGKGYTWLAIVAPGKQVPKLPDVNSFFGNLRNGTLYEGFWAGFDDDNTIWAGARNGVTMGRWDRNNPKLLGPQLSKGKYYLLAGRLSEGVGSQRLELFVNDPAIAAATLPFEVNPKGNPSKMAIGQERDAIEHPGVESFDGSIARLIIFDRPLSEDELDSQFKGLKQAYKIEDAQQWVSIFNGKDLTGWRVLPKPTEPQKTLPGSDVPVWRAEEGVIVGGGGKSGLTANTFLCTDAEYENFELRCQFFLTGDSATGLVNSGIQYRSTIKEGSVSGYQADIGPPAWWGGIYDEHRRNRQLVAGDMNVIGPVLYENGWNNYLVRCTGKDHRLYINGVLTAKYHEEEDSIATRGFIGFQLHAGGVSTVKFRSVYIRELK